MSRLRLGLMTLALAVTLAPRAGAMAGEYGKGDPKHPVSCSTWPKAIIPLANRADRFGGHWINTSDWFYYAGNARAFNDFLAQYAAVKDTEHILYVVAPAAKNAPGFGNTGGGDWQLDIVGWGQGNAHVSLYPGGRIALKDVRIPAGVAVEFIGFSEKDPDVARIKAMLPARKTPEKR